MAGFLETGKKHMQQKDLARAMLDFKNAIRAMPKAAEPHYQLGLAYLDSGDPRSAVVLFRKTLELAPRHVGASLKLAQLMAVSNRPDIVAQAEQKARTILELVPNDPEALDALALAEFRLGKPEEAEQHLNQALSAFPARLQSAVGLAKVKIAKKDLAGAEQVLQGVAKQAPQEVLPPIALAEFYVSTGKVPEAEAQYRRALAIQKNNGMALAGLAGVQFRAGRTQDAENTLKTLSTSGEKQYQPLYGVYLMQSGKRDLAVAEFERLSKQNPDDRSSRNRLVGAYLACGRTQDAERVLSEALKRNSKDADALLDRSRLEVRTANYDQAQKDLSQVIRFRPDSAEAHYLLSRVHKANGDALSRRQELSEAVRLQPNSLQFRTELAGVLTSAKGAKAALEILNAAPKPQHSHPAWIAQKNWALLVMGAREEARKGIEQGLAGAKTPELLLQDGILKLGAKDYSGARSAFQQGLQQSPEDVRLLELLALSYATQGQRPAALKSVQEHAARYPRSARVQEYLGRWLLSEGKVAEARNAYSTAQAADPSFSDVHFDLAQADVMDGKLDSARQHLETLLSVNRRNVNARLALGMLEERAGKVAVAIEHYRAAMEADPRNPVALNNLAYLLANTNQADEAIRYAQQALELQPKSKIISDTLGWAFYRKGMFSSAVKYLEDAVQEPTAVNNYHLSMACAQTGNRARAQQYYQAGLKLDPNVAEARQAQALLAR